MGNRANRALKAGVTRNTFRFGKTCEVCGCEYWDKYDKRREGFFCSDECKKDQQNKLKARNRAIILSRKQSDTNICEDQVSAEIYTVRNTPQRGAYSFTKFDGHLNPLKNYLVTNGECNCPRGETGKRCRHQDMISTFAKAGHIGDGYAFNYATKQWLPPPAPLAEMIADAGEEVSPPPAPVVPPPEPMVLASAPAPTAVSGGGTTHIYRRKL